jgi:peptidoglycan-associated lipoprotein
MKSRRVSTSLFWIVAVCFIISIIAVGCRPPFPECRDDDDCKAEEANTSLFVCVNGQCQECGSDADCPEERPKCKENRCVQCVEDADCPEDKPICENEQCVHECEIDADCETRGKTGMICKEHKCQWECETDEDCEEGNECKDHHCVPKCQCQSNEDCPEGHVCEDCACIERACELQTIYFDFNRYNLRQGDQSTLDSNADCLKQRSDLQVTIEGHCDERGTEEYNISLGDKRARAAKRYLKNLGISADRMKTISYGEGQPACSESNEDCWSQNRRSVFSEQ